MFSIQEVWKEISIILASDLSNLTFNTWIEPLKPVTMSDTEFILSAPNGFIRKTIISRYQKDIETYVHSYLKKPLKIVIIDSTSSEDYRTETVQTVVNTNGQLAFQENETPQTLSVMEDIPKEKQVLIPKYTFDNFIKGKSNELAFEAAKAVAKNPATAYNPLFIWGGPGLGKTHLMQAIAQEILTNIPSAKVVYISSETFTNDLISSIGDRSNKKNVQFRDRYRNIDVLLIDDIQFIAGKQGTQEEFFHTFNDLFGQNKQIIISSDRPPKDIKTLQDRLVSRFEWGLMADIQMPDYETRMAILELKKKECGKDIPQKILQYIAMNVKSNIRELEGVWLRLLAHLEISKKDTISFEEAKHALNNVLQENKQKPITMDLIKELVCEHYSITMEDLESKQRTKTIAYPRQIAMYLGRELTDLSLLKIADAFHRDHSTIMHGIEKITNDMKNNANLNTEINQLIDSIKNC